MRNRIKKTNTRITKRIIGLLKKGFQLDFHLLEEQNFQCLQAKGNFLAEDLCITVIDQVFDQFSRTFKYIHSIETSNGYKGVLLSEQICTTQSLTIPA